MAGPLHGTLTIGNDGQFIYTPEEDFFGSDSFLYRVSDGVYTSNIGIVEIVVSGVNDAPEPPETSPSHTTHANQTLVAGGLLAGATDPEGDNLTAVASGSGPAHGTLTLNADGTFTYIPATDYLGTDSFEYAISDGTLVSSVVTVSIVVENTVPFIISESSYVLPVNGTLSIPAAAGLLALADDPDGDPLTAAVVTQPSHGTLTLNSDGSLIYIPTADYTGTDSFTYKVNDGFENSDTATVSLVITNKQVIANDNRYSVRHDQKLIVDARLGILRDDWSIGNWNLSAVLTSGGGPTHGTLTLQQDGSFVYEPDEHFSGYDSFTYRAYDDSDDSNPSDVRTVTIQVLNTDPVAHNDDYYVLHDRVLTVGDSADGVLANDYDPDADNYYATVIQSVSHGILVFNDNNGTFTYTPEEGFVGEDSFTYQISDWIGQSQAATVTIKVDNHAPSLTADSYRVHHAQSITFNPLANDFDPDQDTMTVVLATNLPTHGTLNANTDGTFTYTPDAAYVGFDYFSYTVSDGADESGSYLPVTVSLEVWDYRPVATSDDAQVDHNSTTAVSIDVLANDLDWDGDALAVILVSPPSHGQVNWIDGKYAYANPCCEPPRA